MKQPAKSNSNIFPVSFTATRFESRFICKFGSSCAFTLHSDADFVLKEYRYMFNESNTYIKVNHKIVKLPKFVHISWHRGHNCVNTLVLIFVIYSMRKFLRCSSFMLHLLTYQTPWNIALFTNIIRLRTFFSSTEY